MSRIVIDEVIKQVKLTSDFVDKNIMASVLGACLIQTLRECEYSDEMIGYFFDGLSKKIVAGEA